nr:metalloregulator ArsR/SmtB family transcription factor [Clostridium sp. 19966]
MSDVVRQNIIVLLAENEEGLNVNSITEVLPLSRPAVSHHLKILKQSGILGYRKKGTENYYYLTLKNPVEKLKEVIKLIEINCDLR